MIKTLNILKDIMSTGVWSQIYSMEKMMNTLGKVQIKVLRVEESNYSWIKEK